MGKYFGTDGFRGYVGQQLTSQHAYRIGRYLGSITPKQSFIFVGQDTRISSPMLAQAFNTGAMASGASIVSLGVITTPAISYFLQTEKKGFGVMISASHNPFYDNGIKLFNSDGEKLNGDVEVAIETYLDQEEDHLPFQTGKQIGQFHPNPTSFTEAYVKFLSLKHESKGRKLKILVDTANGSAFDIAPRLFSALGYSVDVIHHQPTGLNINERCGATHLQSLQATIKKGQYDLGFAFDGDADRMIAVTHDGHEVNGDALIYLNSIHLFSGQSSLKKKVVITQMSNFGLKKALKEIGVEYVETNVGDKYVQAALKKEQLILGGEQSGHVIFLNELNTGDGLMSAIKLLNIIQSSSKTLSDHVLSLKQYPQVLKNIAVENKSEVMNHPELIALIANIESRLGQEGRILVRASGTESLIRVMVEALAPQQCESLVSEVVQFIEGTFQN
jgi:phosphoglucosamine mutase